MRSFASRRAFSLIELVIVVVIIGIIAAIAIPRMSRGAVGANENTLVGNLAVLRKALDLYASEHNGKFPKLANFSSHLTQYTTDDYNVAASATKTATAIYGPYLRAVPALNVGAAKGNTAVVATATAGSFGWVYDEATGAISPNTTASEYDSTGVKLFSSY